MTALFWLSDAPVILAALAGAIFCVVGDHFDAESA